MATGNYFGPIKLTKQEKAMRRKKRNEKLIKKMMGF